MLSVHVVEEKREQWREGRQEAQSWKMMSKPRTKVAISRWGWGSFCEFCMFFF